MKKLRENNQGYTLIEMIICIAVIAILSGMAVLTISSIRTAKATAARESFDQEIAALQMRTKSQDRNTAIRIEKDDRNYNVYYGTYTSAGGFVADNPSDPDVVLERVEIRHTYTPEGIDDAIVTDMVFQFNKSDNYTTSGYGTYTFYKPGSDDSVGSVTINKNTGSHYFGS